MEPSFILNLDDYKRGTNIFENQIQYLPKNWKATKSV